MSSHPMLFASLIRFLALIENCRSPRCRLSNLLPVSVHLHQNLHITLAGQEQSGFASRAGASDGGSGNSGGCVICERGYVFGTCTKPLYVNRAQFSSRGGKGKNGRWSWASSGLRTCKIAEKRSGCYESRRSLHASASDI